MITHSSDSRGVADHGWLKSHHTFSFADYYNPQRMGFGALRVINDDSVSPGKGFGSHPHRDMEIISIPLEGSLKHMDSEGNATTIQKGEVQIMSAGTGIVHSEYNASDSAPVKFLQIWVLPEKKGIKPRYGQKNFSDIDKLNKFITVVSPDGRDGSLFINQKAFFSLGEIESERVVTYEKKSDGNGLYVFILSGKVEIDGKEFGARDGIGIEEFTTITIHSQSHAEILLMEVPV